MASKRKRNPLNTLESQLHAEISCSGDESAEEILKKSLKLANANMNASSSDEGSSNPQKQGKAGKPSKGKQKSQAKLQKKMKKQLV